MGTLIYSMITSLDGYVADREGNFDWAVPDEEVLETVNRDTVGVSTFLYGRTMYETMRVWETDPGIAGQSPRSADFARLWTRADKVVYSTTLPEVDTTRTRLERQFDPDEVRELKARAEGDLTVDGPTLAAHALRHRLVDEVRVLLCPVTVGGGRPMFPDSPLDLQLRDLRRFGTGMVQLYYDVGTATN